MKRRKIGLLLFILLTIMLCLPVQAAKIKLNKTKATITVGKTVQLKITGTKAKVKWSTSNKKVATVTQKGKVTGKKAGKATITAKVGKKKYKCTVTIKRKTSTTAKYSSTTAKSTSIKESYIINSQVAVRIKYKYELPSNIMAYCVFYNGDTPVDSTLDFINHVESNCIVWLTFREPKMEYTKYKITYEFNDARYIDKATDRTQALTFTSNRVITEYNDYIMLTVKNKASTKRSGEISIVFYSGDVIVDVNREYITDIPAKSSKVFKIDGPFDRKLLTDIKYTRYKIYISCAEADE